MVLFFSPICNESAERMGKIVKDLLSAGKEPEIVHGYEALSERLRRPLGSLRIAVLRFDAPDDLSGLLPLRGAFKDLDIILILPDAKSDTLFNGYQLFPRYVCYKNDDLSELILVLAKMIGKHQRQTPGGVLNEAQNIDC